MIVGGDTRFSEAAIELAKDADLLVHEATFAGKLEERAYEFSILQRCRRLKSRKWPT